MVMELVFSFLLNVWKDFPEVDSWAGEHLGGVEALTGEIKREDQILCGLERHRLLSYDSQWKKESHLKIPKECKGAPNRLVGNIEFRSETLPLNHSLSSWDQKIDVVIKGEAPFSVYTRQDKKYIGAHSTAGWSMWIERKSGLVRYEWSDATKAHHFRLKAHVILNPVKGDISKVNDLKALFVSKENGKIKKALLVSGDSKSGFKHVAFQREDKTWMKSCEKCSREHGCKDEFKMMAEEEKLAHFGDISSKKYRDFLKGSHPLAFAAVGPEELVPPTAPFR